MHRISKKIIFILANFRLITKTSKKNNIMLGKIVYINYLLYF